MYYIHIEDPGFPDPPWAGVRRIGPFLTKEEAMAQAASDAATGQGLALGVYDADVSDSSGTLVDEMGEEVDFNPNEIPTVVSQSEIHTAAEEIIKEAVAKQAQEQAVDDAALQSVLDAHGLTVDQLREEGLIS